MMMIFALFLCVATMGTCEIQNPPRMTSAGMMPGITYNTLAACEQSIGSKLGPPDKSGHFQAAGGMYYECRGKHVDTWQPPR
jgi:hypothetical protein